MNDILKQEGITFEKPVIAELVQRYFPDFRRIINECQRYSVSGTIDAGILVNLSDQNIDNLIGYLKGKDFKSMRKWVVDNIDTEPQAIFRKIYDNMSDNLQPQSIPQVVLILADYQYKNAFVADHEINVVACLTEVMAQAQWK